MLKSRILTAIFLIALVFGVIFFAPLGVYLGVLAIFLILSGWEWWGLVPVKRSGDDAEHDHVFARSIFALWIVSGVFFLDLYASTQWILNLIRVDNGLFLGMVIALISYPKTKKYWHSRLTVFFFGSIFLIMAGVAFIGIKELHQGNLWLVSLLLLTWAADTGAYFAGQFWGKSKFAPMISPKKTWAGFVGGLVLGEIVIFVSGYLFAAQLLGWGYWFLAGTLSLLGSVMGDLLVSMFKRCVDLKDTGSILPGHGGVLDRLDSLFVSSMVLFLFLFGKI